MHAAQDFTNAQIPCKKNNYFRYMHSHSRTYSMDQKVIPPTASLSVTSHMEQGLSELWITLPQLQLAMEFIGLDDTTTTTKQMIESCSSWSAILAHSADIMNPLLPHLLHTVHASNLYWCLTVPTAAQSRISIYFHTFKVFHLLHPGIRGLG